MKQSVFSICGMCSVRCPIQVEVENGRVTWIEGNPHDPGMAGRFAPKGRRGSPCCTIMNGPRHP